LFRLRPAPARLHVESTQFKCQTSAAKFERPERRYVLANPPTYWASEKDRHEIITNRSFRLFRPLQVCGVVLAFTGYQAVFR
jgi:hypothetical protein